MVDFTLCCSHLRGDALDCGQLNTYLRIKVALITAAEEGNIAPATYEAALRRRSLQKGASQVHRLPSVSMQMEAACIYC